ncbi:nitrous oxide reductase accessory protein NosL [Ramlibacter sp.]|uniref:nitrous oxide reductase accessory protein NosL n=1 Tax=Ramlibacter sp. TaxID=1917967 RepID=UPI002C6FF50B|nr:nitrous oxide reductase accessory protein NosL [Ramlibacter sp.]HWI80465.1 nitrous oxide reductase accessory protein NosL [Ramlibacter sp.]
MTPHRRHLLLALCAAPLAALVGCTNAESGTVLRPAEIDPATTCDLDGMLLADYGGPKAQIHYAGQAAPVFFCDTVEMFAQLLRPEQVRPVRAVFVQDMARADWDQPRGHWFDARTGFYVIGSKRRGSMGPTFASFAQEAEARKFAAQYGGKVLPFAEVTPQLADLSGGASHDTRM